MTLFVLFDHDQGQFAMSEVELDDFGPVKSVSSWSSLAISSRLNSPEKETDLLIPFVDQDAGGGQAQGVGGVIFALG